MGPGLHTEPRLQSSCCHEGSGMDGRTAPGSAWKPPPGLQSLAPSQASLLSQSLCPDRRLLDAVSKGALARAKSDSCGFFCITEYSSHSTPQHTTHTPYNLASEPSGDRAGPQPGQTFSQRDPGLGAAAGVKRGPLRPAEDAGQAWACCHCTPGNGAGLFSNLECVCVRDQLKTVGLLCSPTRFFKATSR